MSTGWSLWVIGLIVFNLGVTFFLFLWAPRAKVPVLPDGTTGHVWANGSIREGMHPLPKWWIFFSFAMFFAAFGYFILYPGFGNSTGTLDWTSGKELAETTEANNTRLEPVLQRLSAMSVEAVADDPEAGKLGKRLFIENCSACHGREGQGNSVLGAPDLTDGDWLYGSSGEQITTTLHDGRHGVMPPWQALGDLAIRDLVQYVRSLSGQPHDPAAALEGKALFGANCVACHGADGKGTIQVGAPDLTDGIWLHGGSLAQIETSIRLGRQGHMPAWSTRLSGDEIHLLAGYVTRLSRHGKQGPR